jgi:hypothetical protein
MKHLLTVTAISVAVALLLMPLAYGQEKAAPQAEKVFQGQLSKIDPTAKLILVTGAGDKEMVFEYTDSTQIVGAQNVQGLTGKPGTELKVTYREAGGKNTATKIETIEKK